MQLYATPRLVDDLTKCYFYHTIDLPEIGTVPGNWDLRGNVGTYLGGFEFAGKRALDVGCASGMLSQFMESQGASVISYDLDKSGDWDMVPYAKWEHYLHIANERKSIIDRLNNSYWLGHRLTNSKAKVVYGAVYAIPDAIGPVDVAVFGAILLHLRDPFFALQNGLKLAKETAIVTECMRSPIPKPPVQTEPVEGVEAAVVYESPAPAALPILRLLPDFRTVEPKDTWWDITPEWTIWALGVLGFEDATVTYHTHKYDGIDNDLYTVVAHRKHGKAVGV